MYNPTIPYSRVNITAINYPEIIPPTRNLKISDLETHRITVIKRSGEPAGIRQRSISYVTISPARVESLPQLEWNMLNTPRCSLPPRFPLGSHRKGTRRETGTTAKLKRNPFKRVRAGRSRSQNETMASFCRWFPQFSSQKIRSRSLSNRVRDFPAPRRRSSSFLSSLRLVA